MPGFGPWPGRRLVPATVLTHDNARLFALDGACQWAVAGFTA
ncbi:hypothetical protein C8K30_103402 [Promicromonospora sp. AC04]|nr:hypothetical protein [Promicromonospora sp. AC04]PUB28976.1 hypothetical protein C8K30_103402 [Promicromonospora sp. AC04]